VLITWNVFLRWSNISVKARYHLGYLWSESRMSEIVIQEQMTVTG